MKKIYLLSGMVILGVNLNAMQSYFSATQSYSSACQELDLYTKIHRPDWKNIFRVLKENIYVYAPDENGIELSDLVNKYRWDDVGEKRSLLELAVEENDMPAARRLLTEFKAEVTLKALEATQSFVNKRLRKDWQTLLQQGGKLYIYTDF